MKKRSLIIILIMLILSNSILPVRAVSYLGGGGQGERNSFENDCGATDDQCHNTEIPINSSVEDTEEYNESPNALGWTGGVRISIVDANGIKIKGTKSIDLTRKNMQLECGENCKDLHLSYLKVADEFKGKDISDYSVSGVRGFEGKQTRMQTIFDFESGCDSTKSGDSPLSRHLLDSSDPALRHPLDSSNPLSCKPLDDLDETNDFKYPVDYYLHGKKYTNLKKIDIYYWKDLPWVFNVGNNTKLNDFFMNLKPEVYDKLFYLMDYSSYEAWTRTENDAYIQVQPTVYMSITNNTATPKKTIERYYGTVAEITAMLIKDQKWLYGYFYNSIFIGSIYMLNPYKSSIVTGFYSFGSPGHDKQPGGQWENRDFYNDHRAQVYSEARRYLLTVWPYHYWKSTDQFAGQGNAIGAWKITDLVPRPCSYDYDYKSTNSCKFDNGGYVKDQNFNKCLLSSFDESSYAGRSQAERGYVRQFYHPDDNHDFDDNKYCKVICREEISYTLSDDKMIVNNGSRYTIGQSGSPSNISNLSPVTFKGVSICRTGFSDNQTVNEGDTHGKIDYEQFRNDWNVNENRKISAFNSGDSAEYYRALNDGKNMLAQIMSCNNFQRTYSSFDPQVSYGAEPNTVYNYTYQLKGNPSIVSKTKYYNSSNGVIETTSWNTSNYSNTNNTFTIANNFVREPNTPLQNIVTNSHGGMGSISYSTCDFSTRECTRYSVRYPINEWVEQTTEKTINFTLPDNVYQYQSKSSGISYSNEYEVKSKNQGYTKIPYSNLPIPYQMSFEQPYTKIDDNNYTKVFKYAYELYYTKDGVANLFGQRNKFLKFDYKGDLQPGNRTKFGTTDLFVSNLKYVCEYTIHSGIVPATPDNPNPVPQNLLAEYRSVSLSDPFPGQNGNGRLAGKNWDGTTPSGLSYTQAFITQNRGVNGNEVYNIEPMYEFVISAKNINAIKTYNRSHSYDDTSTLDCDSDGKYCISKFVRNGIDNSYFTIGNTSGTCFNSTKGTWESCRYGENTNPTVPRANVPSATPNSGNSIQVTPPSNGGLSNFGGSNIDLDVKNY